MELEEVFGFVEGRLDGFPKIDYRFSTLHDYIDELSEFLEFSYIQKLQRLKAKIASEVDDVKKGEMECELFQLEEQGMERLSHTIWGGVLVTIFATYESDLQELFTFFEKKHGKPRFKKEPRKSFIECAQKYSMNHLNVSIYSRSADKKILEDLTKLRNSYVHNGCSLDRLPNKLQDAIATKQYKLYSLNTEGGKWVANANNSKLYFKCVYECFVSYRRRIIDTLFSGIIKKA